MARFGSRLFLLAALAGAGCDPSTGVRGPNGPGGPSGGSDAGMPFTQPSCGTGADLTGCNCDSAGEQRACWTGPIADRSVGACHDGTQVCGATGEFLTWGTCSGAVMSMPELCSGGADEDCDGLVDCADSDCAADPACAPECQTGAAQPCYGGPAGTSGVGICKPGTRTCDATGHWGSCTGDVQPGASENFFSANCSDGLDNDCNGVADCQELGCLLSPGCAPKLCEAGTTQSCYTGSPGTSGVGVCKPGTQTCASDGKSWGPCNGQVTPSNEGVACTDGLDNDCNGQTDCADGACATAPSCCRPSSGTVVDDTIWANSSTDLYTVDPTTFALTHVGAFGISDEMTDIAVTPSGDLYGVSFTALYRIDKTSAAATYVAAVSGTGNNGLTFLPDGSLLAADGAGDVKRIDPMSGIVTPLGNFGQGLSSSGDLVAVGGVMYGISSTGAGGTDASANNVLLRVDATTGVATIVGPIGFGRVWGLAYAGKRVIAFSTTGQIIQIDPATGAGTLLANRSVQFWGAGMSPDVPANNCN